MLQRVPLWLEQCERVVLYDLRGHGEAAGTSRLGAGEERDLLALIGRLGEGRCVLAGHSMGAVIAINAAASDDAAARNIAAVVAYGPYADFHASLRGRLRGVGMPTRPITDLALLWLRLRGVQPPAALQAALRMKAPLLVIHGRDDEMVGVDEARGIVAAARNAELLEIGGAGHLDAHLVDAAQHGEAVGAFVVRIGSAA
jgi:pimeloyl-ACP methyl ester carboxylesterase